jgi:hypothetical protein
MSSGGWTIDPLVAAVQRYNLAPSTWATTIALIMEAARTSKTSVDIQLRTRQYIPEDSELQLSVCQENLYVVMALGTQFGKHLVHLHVFVSHVWHETLLTSMCLIFSPECRRQSTWWRAARRVQLPASSGCFSTRPARRSASNLTR